MAQTVVTLTSQGRRRSGRTGFSWSAFLVPTLGALSEGLWRQCAFSLLTVLASRIALDAARIYGFPFLGIVRAAALPAHDAHVRALRKSLAAVATYCPWLGIASRIRLEPAIWLVT